MALELRKRVVELLSANPDKKFKARDIAEWVCRTYPEEADQKLEESVSIETRTQLLNQLVAEIGSNRPSWEKKHSQLRTTEGVRPRLYYWTSKSEKDEVDEAEREGDPKLVGVEEAKLREHDLYPLIIEYLRSEHGVRAYRVDEKKSSNKNGSGGNKWLFPDVVGMDSLTEGLNSEVVAAIRAGKERGLRLWSFEVKMLINRSNAREVYFQAISNSSWANMGYLVAAEIEGADTLKEIRILFAVHGIGLIKLDSSNPAESQILIPARERLEVEWPMCSRLADENKDFLSYVRKVRQFFQTGDLAGQ